MNIMLPNLLICGAQKSGTSALRYYLGQHPDIFMADGEIHFFDDEDHFSNGVEWYERCFEDVTGETVVGEKTPDYMYHDYVPERIQRILPDAKLIFLFRNPVDRAYSHYWHERQRGREKLSFEEAIDAEEERLDKSGQYRSWFSYKDRGKYAVQVKRFLELFDRSQMLFLLTENLKERRHETLENVLRFLDMDSSYEFDDLSKRHVGGKPKSSFLSKLMGNSMISKVKPLYYAIKRLNVDFGQKPPMKAETRRHLRDYFEEYNRGLSELTGVDVGMWR